MEGYCKLAKFDIIKASITQWWSLNMFFLQFLSTDLPISLQETVVQRTSPKPIGRPRISTLNDIDMFFETENAIWTSPQNDRCFSPLDLSWFHNPESSLATQPTTWPADLPTEMFGNRGQPIRGPFQWKGPLWYGVPIQLPSQGPSTISYSGQGCSLGSLGCVTRDSGTWSRQGMWHMCKHFDPSDKSLNPLR